MRIAAALAVIGVFGLSTAAQARHHAPRHVYARPLVVNVLPRPYPPYGDPYAYFSPPGPYQLSSPFHTLCGLTLATQCALESSYGP